MLARVTIQLEPTPANTRSTSNVLIAYRVGLQKELFVQRPSLTPLESLGEAVAACHHDIFVRERNGIRSATMLSAALKELPCEALLGSPLLKALVELSAQTNLVTCFYEIDLALNSARRHAAIMASGF